MHPSRSSGSESAAQRPQGRLWVLGAALVALVAISTALWSGLGDGAAEQAQSRLFAVVGVHVLAGIVFLSLIALLHRRGEGGTAIVAGVLVLGAAMRFASAPAAPGWEDDYYRYLWDGAVVAHGENPYRHSPEQALEAIEGAEPVRDGYLAAAQDEQAQAVLGSINHPHLRTIYPPLAQASFALAHLIEPWNLNAWRFVLLMHDAAVCALLLVLLRTLALPLAMVGVYWINPLVVKELYQAAHMDVLALPWVLGALLAAVRWRNALGSGLLAAAAAVKIWPVLLAPLLVRSVAGNSGRSGEATAGVKRSSPFRSFAVSLSRSSARRAVIVGAIFILVGAALMAPMLVHEPSDSSGLARYAESWENNAGFFVVHHAFWHAALPLVGVEAWHSQTVTRWATAGLIGALVLAISWAPIADGRDLCRRAMWIVTGLFLLSPTQFPWYYLWVVPLLAISPRPSLLLYSALLPLYHVQEAVPWIGWVQHAPVWALLGWEVFANRRAATRRMTGWKRDAAPASPSRPVACEPPLALRARYEGAAGRSAEA